MTRQGNFAGKIWSRREREQGGEREGEEEKRRGGGIGREGRKDVFRNIWSLTYGSILPYSKRK